MNYPPETSRSCHEADGRSDRSGGSGGATGSASGMYGPLANPLGTACKWTSVAGTTKSSVSDPCNIAHHGRLVSNWRKWSLGLDYLLQDSEGVALFKSYLQYEGCSNLLDFWFACQGFRSKIDPSDNRKISQLIKAIYRTYIRGSGSKAMTPLSSLLSDSQAMIQPRTEPIRLRTETRRLIAERISRKHSVDQTVFDPAQAEVEHFLRTTAYPAFLKSDVYVDFLQSTVDTTSRGFQCGQKSASCSNEMNPCSSILSGLPDCSTNFLLTGKTLPTLDEDKELRSEELSNHADQLKRSAPEQSYAQFGAQLPELFYSQHCPHCSQYHSQGHQSVCSTNAIGGIGPLGSPPFAADSTQIAGFCRPAVAQQDFTNPPMNLPRSHQHRSFSDGKDALQTRLCGSKIGHPRAHLNYMYTHWVDAIRPPCLAPVPDPRLVGHLPSQPPNPYHISYAPVSTRDSERHSLSSEARTEDTHSHADSGHEGIATLIHQCAYNNRRPDRHSVPHQQNRRVQANEAMSENSGVAFTSIAYQPDAALVRSPPEHAQVSHCGALSRGHRSSVDPRTNVPSDSATQWNEGESSRTHSRHHRGSSKRGGGYRGKSAGSNDAVGTAAAPVVTSKSNVRSHNLAEKDPAAFFRLLSDKLQRVLEGQIAEERLDRLMTESSPNPPRSNDGEQTEKSPVSTDVTAPPPVSDQQRSGSTASSLLQRPWADRLLAAARVQHADNAQAILEDHCSRIWAASADRTPTSSGSGSGGANPLLTEPGTSGDQSVSLAQVYTEQHALVQRTTPGPRHPVQADLSKKTNRKQQEPQLSVHSPRSVSMVRSSIGTTLSQSEGPTDSKRCVGPSDQTSSRFSEHELFTAHVYAEHQNRPFPPVTSTVSFADPRLDQTEDDSPIFAAGCRLPQDIHSSHMVPVSRPTTTTIHSTCSASSSSVTTSVLSTSTPGVIAGSPPSSSSNSPHSLVIGYYLGDDPVPYRSIWPSTEITLGQFKQLIPRKKGTFRFFFKKCSDEFGSGVVHQEITNDQCVLPLWEGKVVAKVERIE